MATIINNPNSGGDSSEGAASMIIGAIIFLIAVFLFFVYALPALRNNGQQEQPAGNIDVNVELPAGSTPTE